MNEVAFILKLQKVGIDYAKEFVKLSDEVNIRVIELLNIIYLPKNYFYLKSASISPVITNKDVYYSVSKHTEFTNITLTVSKSVSKYIEKEVIKFLQNCPNPQQKLYIDLLQQTFKFPFSINQLNKVLSDNGYQVNVLYFKNTSVITKLYGKYISQPKLHGKKVMVKIEDSEVYIITENNKRVFYPDIERELLKYFDNDYQFYGIIDENGVLNIFDSVYFKDVTLSDRLLILDLIRINFKFNPKVIKIVESFVINNILEFLESDNHNCIIKDYNSLYDSSHTWHDLSKYTCVTASVVGVQDKTVYTSDKKEVKFRENSEWMLGKLVNLLVDLDNRAMLLSVIA